MHTGGCHPDGGLRPSIGVANAARVTRVSIRRLLSARKFGSDSISMMVASDNDEEADSEHIQIGTSQKSDAGRPPDCRSGLVRRHLASISAGIIETATDPILKAD